ncbi:hypothetical protein [Melghirimyces algeriensis]|uniref:Uncharacterized protein n=1 Tax=Melghirimyces algeriensis TaxID=910412 RepID=A0A521BR02_9BACL|nr:hypothetical protein [Melghirimyces algeriensis]SMO49597.1 hypothetical protein SAMN06264849_102323 [Melghirimyces algeriensis]
MDNNNRRITIAIPADLDHTLEQMVQKYNQKKTDPDQFITKTELIQEAVETLAEEYIAKYVDTQD